MASSVKSLETKCLRCNSGLETFHVWSPRLSMECHKSKDNSNFKRVKRSLSLLYSVPILVPKWFFTIQILRISVSTKLQCMLWSRSLKSNLLELLLYWGTLRVSLGSCRFQVGSPKLDWCSEVNSTGRSSRRRGFCDSSSRGSDAHLWPPWHQAHTRCTGVHADPQSTHTCWLNMQLMQCLREILAKCWRDIT